MTTLITGGFGFIGGHVVRKFMDAGETIVVTSYDNTTPPSFLNQACHDGLPVIRCDVGEPGQICELVQKYEIDTIVNLAIHRKSSPDPAEDIRINMDKLSYFFDGALKGGVKKLFWASNGAVFSELPQGPFSEDTAISLTGNVQPGAFKKAWEILAHNFANNYQNSASMRIISMRISGVFGPTYRSMLNLPSRLCHAAVRNIQPDFSIARGGIPYANATFDLTYVKDVADAILSLSKAPDLSHSAYNISRNSTVTAQELVDAVSSVKSNFNVELQAGPGPNYRPDAYLSNTRIISETDWKPKFDINAGIQDYLDWLNSKEEY
tara:strand:- start:7612 stop:8577 length:966 start_codon:yes stop_codon:yes gene_type:complete